MEFFLLITLLCVVSYASVIITKSVKEAEYHELLRKNDESWQCKINDVAIKYTDMINDAQAQYDGLKLEHENLETAFMNMRNSNKSMGETIDDLKSSKALLETENKGLRIASIKWKEAYDNLEKEMADKETEHQTQTEELTRYYEEKISNMKQTD